MKDLRKLLTAILFSAVAATAFAAGPYGGTVLKMTPDADDAGPKFCATSKGLFQKKGSSWEVLSPLGLSKVTAVAVSGNTILAGVEGRGLSLSEDKGATWKPVVEGLRSKFGRPVDDVTDIKVDKENGSVVYMGTGGKGFFVSQDKGKTWKLLQEGLEVASPAALHVQAILPPQKERPLLMGTDGDGLFAWRENKWVQIGGGLPKPLKVSDLAADPSNHKHLALSSVFSGLWESADGGENWKPTYKGNFAVATAVAIGYDGAVASYFGQEGLIVVREGAPPKVNYLGYAVVKGIQPKPSGGFFAAFLNDGIRVSDKDGMIVGSDNAGLNALTIRSFMDDSDGKGLWVGDANGAFFTADGGKTWEERSKGFIAGDVTGFVRVDGKLYAGTAGQGVFLWDREKKEWIFRGRALGTSNTIYSMDKTSDGKIYVATEGGVLWTSDGGVNWTRTAATIPLSSRMSVAADPKTPGHLWAANGAAVYETTDGGETWSSLFKGDYWDVKFAAGSLWAMGVKDVSRLAGGKLEVVYKSEGDRLQSLLPAADALFVGTDKGLLRVKGGKGEYLWKDAGVSSIHIDPAGKVLAGSDGRGVNTVKIK